MDRVRNIEKIIYRIVQRKMGRPFQGQVKYSKTSKENYEVYLSTPRAASFAVSLKIGKPESTDDSQGKFPDMEPAAEVLNEMVSCLDLVNQGDTKSLREKIPDDLYYDNFVQLARQIAPDGIDVSQVGITFTRGGKEQRVAFQRQREQIPVSVKPISGEGTGEDVRITGSLQYADAISKKPSIKLVEKGTGKKHTIFVPESMMSDIVRPLWEYVVVVSGTKSKNGILLKGITKSSE